MNKSHELALCFALYNGMLKACGAQRNVEETMHYLNILFEVCLQRLIREIMSPVYVSTGGECYTTISKKEALYQFATSPPLKSF